MRYKEGFLVKWLSCKEEVAWYDYIWVAFLKNRIFLIQQETHYICTFTERSKGHLISKGLFGILNSSKKWTKKFDLTNMIPQVDLFLFIFWKNLKTPKRHFKICWPLATTFVKVVHLSKKKKKNKKYFLSH